MPLPSRASKAAPRVGFLPFPGRDGIDPDLPASIEPRDGRESDAVLVDGWTDLAAIVNPLVGVMTRASRRILHDDASADDAIQEAILTFWSRSERPANPRAWLLHAVTLRSLHLARTSRRRREHERRACLGRPEESIRDDPSRTLDHPDLLRILDETLGHLPEEYRIVFDLWAFEEMDYAGIAERLQIPLGTVRSRLSRSRKAIGAALGEKSIDQGSR